MLDIYFYAFAALTAAMLAPLFWRPSAVYEYPRFMAIAFAVFILPQAYALYRGAWGGSYLETTLLMCSLCLGCCWVGYHWHAHPGLLRKLNVRIDPNRFFVGGVTLVILAWISRRQFVALPEEMLSSQMTGIGTIYLFFAGLVYPGFAICFYCALKEKRVIAWIVSVLAAVLPLQGAIFGGRREPTALFLLTLGLSLYFVKGLRPPRVLVYAMILGAALFIPATSEYRTRAGSDPLRALQEIEFAETFGESLQEESVNELKNATALIAATQITGEYQFGIDYWNAVIFRFVPAQFVGKEFKESLMFGGVQRDFGGYVERVLGFPLAMGTTVTGIGDSFNQFGYLGCFFFAGLGYLFRTLWAAANPPRAAVAQILYIQSVTTAMRSVTHETIDFLPGFIYSVIFIGAIAWYAKERGVAPTIQPAFDRSEPSPTNSR